jgi:AraC-like DNA-binding protein
VDVLTDALVAMRTGEPQSTLRRLSSPWSLHFPPVKGAGFHVVLEGSCWLVAPEGPPLRLGPGDVAFLHRGRGHGLAEDPATALAAIEAGAAPADTSAAASVTLLCGSYQLDQVRPHPLLRDLPDVLHLPAKVGRHPSLRTTVELLGTELGAARPGTDAVVPALVDILLFFILRTWIDEQPELDGGWPAALATPGIAAALEAIHAEPARPWTVEELGRCAGMSRAVFARRFAALVGEPPLTYLTRWRLQRAAHLLRSSDEPLRAISERIGYTSSFAFAKSFKRAYGVAPGTYRKDLAGHLAP